MSATTFDVYAAALPGADTFKSYGHQHTQNTYFDMICDFDLDTELGYLMQPDAVVAPLSVSKGPNVIKPKFLNHSKESSDSIALKADGKKKRIRWSIGENVVFVQEMKKFPSGSPFSEGYGKVKAAWETLAERLKGLSYFSKYEQLNAKKCQEHFKRLHDEFVTQSQSNTTSARQRSKYQKYPKVYIQIMKELHNAKTKSGTVKDEKDQAKPEAVTKFSDQINLKRSRDEISDILSVDEFADSLFAKEEETSVSVNKKQRKEDPFNGSNGEVLNVENLEMMLVQQENSNQRRFEEIFKLVESQQKIIEMLLAKQQGKKQ